jgi:hypothetical protein
MGAVAAQRQGPEIRRRDPLPQGRRRHESHSPTPGHHTFRRYRRYRHERYRRGHA